MLDRTAESAFAAVLGAHQLHASISAKPQFCGRFMAAEPASEQGYFHLVDEGECVVDIAGVEPIGLSAGDLILLPSGTAHVLRSPDDADEASPRHTALLCGAFAFATGRRNPILRALPDALIVRAADSQQQLRHLAELMLHEARQSAFGRELVLDKLADALFVMVLRHHITHSNERRGLLAALGNPRLARVLAALHADLSRPWTVAMLAELAHQSRTVFAQHFHDVLGVTPYHYLTEARMAEAMRLLADPRLSAAAVAVRLGYQTEAAFRRAFKQAHGYGPGRVRREARDPARDSGRAVGDRPRPQPDPDSEVTDGRHPDSDSG